MIELQQSSNWLLTNQLTSLNCTHYFSWLTPRLAAISHQPPSLLFTDWLITADKVKVKVILRLAVVTPVSSSLRQSPWDSRSKSSFFFQLNPYGHSSYVTSSLTRRWVHLLWIRLASQVYVSHIQHVMENSSCCTIYKSSVSTDFAKQIMPILLYLTYLMLQRQLSHLNGRKLDHRQV
jgi:hypothetical protein